MSTPRFFPRVSDSITPFISAGTDVEEFVRSCRVLLQAPPNIEIHQFHAAGFLLIVNLCARLYPTIRVVAPKWLAEESRALAVSINPQCDFESGEKSGDSFSAELAWASERESKNAISVAPVGWEVVIDLPEARRVHTSNMLTALAGAAVAASELFRHVFADFLPKGRTTNTPGRFNVLFNAPSSAPPPEVTGDIDIGRVHLVGAGAIGQAAAYALARVSAKGTIVVVDPEVVTLANLQRYVLTTDSDVGTTKCALIERAFAKTKRIETVGVETSWNVEDALLTTAEVVLSAVDTASVRVALQAGLPRVIFNAWTQPDDLGWSRHESFGMEPCLACLYWPTQRRPSFHQNVSSAIRQHELRVLAYLVNKIPVDKPILKTHIPKLVEYPLPQEAAVWSERSLLDDIVATLDVDPAAVEKWKGSMLGDLYRDGICGGALVRKQIGDVPTEMAVPLAHQSVLAGIMLATQLLVAANDDLRVQRNPIPESRLDLLSGFPQIVTRPRQRTPGCICHDQDFLDKYHEQWGRHA